MGRSASMLGVCPGAWVYRFEANGRCKAGEIPRKPRDFARAVWLRRRPDRSSALPYPSRRRPHHTAA